MKDRPNSIHRYRLLRSAALALGLASAAAMAHAETTAAPPTNAATASPSDPTEGMTVTGRRPDTGVQIPAEKRAAYDAEVAREAAFRAYRGSTPQLTADDKGISDPNGLAEDFPGLRTYLPQ